MVKKLLLIVLGLALFGGGFWYFVNQDPAFFDPKTVGKVTKEMNLKKYDFDSLKKRGGKAGEIQILGPIKAVEDRRKNCRGENCLTKAQLASFETHEIKFNYQTPDGGVKQISGMINMPKLPYSHKLPAVIMVRGFAETAGYYPGSGSWKLADKLAANGFVTVSMDFLGYADSDMSSADILEARFEKVPAVMDLMASVKNLGYVDAEHVGIWAHSNGGQIVLSVIEVMGGNYPTVMWAPMTNPFPQSVLDTTDDDEPGRIVRAAIEEFGKHYDYRRYAFENYYSWVKSPVVIHQGTADEWCKVEWQQDVVAKLTAVGQEAKLMVYQGEDHNFSKNWKEVSDWDVEWFKSKLVE